MANVREANPGAEFVYAAPPRVAGHFPVVYAWHPMHGNGHGIVRRNDADRVNATQTDCRWPRYHAPGRPPCERSCCATTPPTPHR